jgi:peptidyl-prolyl cis-trans isomerase A (cyclophilin A)
VQGGGYDAPSTTNNNQITPKTAVNPPIPLQSNNGLKNVRGSVGMAREPNLPNSATSQYFFNLKDNPQLDYESEANPGLAVFARVVQGQAVLDEMGAVKVRFDLRLGLANLPEDNIIVTAVTQTR